MRLWRRRSPPCRTDLPPRCVGGNTRHADNPKSHECPRLRSAALHRVARAVPVSGDRARGADFSSGDSGGIGKAMFASWLNLVGRTVPVSRCVGPAGRPFQDGSAGTPRPTSRNLAPRVGTSACRGTSALTPMIRSVYSSRDEAPTSLMPPHGHVLIPCGRGSVFRSLFDTRILLGATRTVGSIECDLGRVGLSRSL